jgi:23S rRNA pseudouridine1911/1915/1917 synthase
LAIVVRPDMPFCGCYAALLRLTSPPRKAGRIAFVNKQSRFGEFAMGHIYGGPPPLDNCPRTTISSPMDGGIHIIEAPLGANHVGQRLDKALADALPQYSRERIKALISAGAVSDGNGRPCASGARAVDAPATFRLTVPAAKPLETIAQAIPLVIAYEDEHLIMVDKPAGMVVHPANGNWDGTLVNALLHHCAGQLSGIGGVARPGIVHRIDKDTSGLIVVAKTDAAHAGLAAQFFDHSIERIYQAIVHGTPAPPAGTVDAPLARSTADRTRIAVTRDGSGKRAVTHFRVVQPFEHAALIECKLETGRTHQVRVHMAYLGHPLLGDPVYARGQARFASTLRDLGFCRQALHAARLGFIHPVTGETIRRDSVLPDDMNELLTRIAQS